jgi:translation elongation factor EF-1alpha
MIFIHNTFREHAILVRSLGVSQLVVAVNKLDTVDWSQQRFNDIRDKLRLFLTKQVLLLSIISVLN